MENAILPSLPDLFGEQVVIQRRSFMRRTPRSNTTSDRAVSLQISFLDILTMDDEVLERERQADVITDDYIGWMREYLLELTLRQLVHPQTSEVTWRDGMDWLLSNAIHPFSFRVCCEALLCDFEEIRENTLSLVAQTRFN